MKRKLIIGTFSLFFTFMSLATTATADEKSSEPSELYGDIQVGVGIMSGHPSGLDVLNSKKSRDDLYSKGQRHSEGIAFLSGNIGYTFKEIGTTLGVGIRTEGPLYFSLSHEFESVADMTLSALYEKNMVWKNPYLVGVNRSRTDQDSFGFAVNMRQILRTGLHFKFEQMNVDIKEDLIGQLDPDLRRDGTDTTVGIGYDWNLGARGALSSNLSHTWYDREGTGNEGCSYVAELKHMIGAERLTFVTGLEFKQTQFDATHPIFNKKRQESTYSISEMVSFAEPLGYESWSVFIIAAYGATDSNIRFFDSSILFAGSGIGYEF
jgi:hypothetical protein